RRNQIVRTDSQTKKSDAHIPERAHYVWLDARLEGRTAKIVIGRDKIKVRKLHRRNKTRDTVIEIMIAKCPYVVANQRHRLVLDFTFIEVEVGRPLKDIARINQKRVRIFLADTLDQRRAPRNAAFAAVLFVAVGDW